MTNAVDTTKKRGRPPGPAKPTGERMSASADRVLLGWLRHGVTTWSGQLDDKGEPIYIKRPLSAAQMQCVLKRLNQIGAAARQFDRHRSAANLVDEARRRFGSNVSPGYRFPKEGGK